MVEQHSTTIVPVASDVLVEQCRKLWQVHGIIELAIVAIRENEADDGRPVTWTALQAAADQIHATINMLSVQANSNDH